MTVAQFAALTDTGAVREHNEDSVLAQDPLFAVADGVGGAASGEVASKLALDTLAKFAEPISAAHDVGAALADAIENSNRAVYEHQTREADTAGMATTITAAMVSPEGDVVIGHVGDSRAYSIRGATSTQLTDDHSVVGDLVRSGRLSPKEAATHPQRNVITRALGTNDQVEVDLIVHEPKPGEWLLLCSDGLTGYVDDEELAATVRASGDPDRAAHELVRMANERGGADNVSVVLFQPVAASHDAPAAESTISDEVTLEGAPLAAPRANRRRSDSTSGAGKARRLPRPAWRTVIIAAVAAVVAFLASIVVWQQTYFLTETADGTVAIHQGFPIAGLSHEYRSSHVRVEDLTEVDRERSVDSHTVRSRESALKLLGELEDKELP